MKSLKTMLILLIALCLNGCSQKGQTPAVDDVAQGQPEAGLVEAWEGEMTAEAAEEENGPRTERNDLCDENGVPYGYDICQYDDQDRITLEEQFDLDGNCTDRWERSYSEDGRECVTHYYRYGEFDTKMVALYDERGMETELRSYDSLGALMSVSLYDENGGLALTENYGGEPGAEWKMSEVTCDENGRVNERGYNPDGSFAFECTREYDEYNREVADIYYEGGVFRWNRRNTYDERGFCTRMDDYDENGALLYYTLMDYTPAGLCCLEEEYSAAGELLDRECTEYREDGQLLSRHRYNGKEELTEYTLWEYDELDRVVLIQDYDPMDEPGSCRKYRYAEDGSYRVTIFYADGRVAGVENYDAYGNYLD